MNQTLAEIEAVIKECEARIAMYNRQLSEHEEGTRKLTPMARTSSETKLENTIERLERYKLKQAELLELDSQLLVEQEQELIAARRKIYFDNQERRVKRSREYPKKVKIEVLTTLSELPPNALFEDDELFDMAIMSIKLQIREHTSIYLRYKEIENDLKELLKTVDISVIDDHKILIEHIPFVVLFLNILNEDIKESKKDDKKYSGFPKYEDWWIAELWSSHQAYFSLYKWREIIYKLCSTKVQRKVWAKTFVQWLNIKKMLNQKGAKAYGFTLVFDKLVLKYAEIEEELEEKNIATLETIMKRVSGREDFSKVIVHHNIITPYLEFRKNS